MLDRKHVIQKLIDNRGFKSYLEIGVQNGGVFLKVRCSKKVAVDPEFGFSAWKRFRKTIVNPTNISAQFFEVTSDEFFEKNAPTVFGQNTVDLVFVDGMHEFDYVLNDVNNSLRYLSENGVIILHDCNPLTPDAAVSFQAYKDRGYTRTWNGDVWKAIPYLKKHRPDLEIFVADCDQGLGIITRKGKSGDVADVGREEFRNMSYSDLESRRKELLNLQPESYLLNFVAA